uniref:Death domain-containing protein n=1 Tax=Branchiostoma floridae TaxID=7739 RepID=C3Y798_BRAFL|eukprot:XP_002607716.1 hypothetical protein BRAFLDRAFT_82837 [Branchiostoma floridae]
MSFGARSECPPPAQLNHCDTGPVGQGSPRGALRMSPARPAQSLRYRPLVREVLGARSECHPPAQLNHCDTGPWSGKSSGRTPNVTRPPSSITAIPALGQGSPRSALRMSPARPAQSLRYRPLVREVLGAHSECHPPAQLNHRDTGPWAGKTSGRAPNVTRPPSSITAIPALGQGSPRSAILMSPTRPVCTITAIPPLVRDHVGPRGALRMSTTHPPALWNHCDTGPRSDYISLQDIEMDLRSAEQGSNLTIDRLFNRLAGEVRSRQWKKIAREIGLTEPEIDAIEDRDRTNLHEKVFQMFYKWRMKNGRRATLGVLAGHLRDINMAALAEKLEDIRN